MSRIQISDFKGKMINMHTHTARCMHARGEDREYVEKAIEAGFEVLGMSDHVPYVLQEGYISPIRMRWDELDGYVDSVLSLKKEYEKDIEIYCGFETEYFPKFFERTMERLESYPIDYMLLGQHYYDDEIGKISPKNGWEDEEHLKMYVDRIMVGIKTDRFLYVAHPDIMNFWGDEAIYRKHMRPLIQEIKRRGMPIEINMNGLRSGLEYPTPTFVEMAVEEGCDFIVGVDAHAPRQMLDFKWYQDCIDFAESRGGHVINQLRIK